MKLLIVAELGYVPLSPTGAELLFETFSQRYERGSISKAGNRYLRKLLVVGALSVIKRAKQLGHTHYPWLTKLMERRPVKIAAIALANKNARTVWAMMARNESYRAPKTVAA